MHGKGLVWLSVDTHHFVRLRWGALLVMILEWHSYSFLCMIFAMSSKKFHPQKVCLCGLEIHTRFDLRWPFTSKLLELVQLSDGGCCRLNKLARARISESYPSRTYNEEDWGFGTVTQRSLSRYWKRCRTKICVAFSRAAFTPVEVNRLILYPSNKRFCAEGSDSHAISCRAWANE